MREKKCARRLNIFLSAYLAVLLCLYNTSFSAAFDNYGGGEDEQSISSDVNTLGEKSEHEVPQYVPGEVLVKFKEGTLPSSVLQDVSIEVRDISRVHPITPVVSKFRQEVGLEKDSNGWYWFRDKIYKQVDDINKEELFEEAYKQLSPMRKGLYRNYKIALQEGVSVEWAVSQLRADQNVEYAYPNYIRRLYAGPNDPNFSIQWALKNTGQFWSGTEDADIDAPEAWEIIAVGHPDIVIAVIDSGVEYNHEDLAARMWINEDEVPGNGIDDDGNGYVDDIRGWDFVSEDNDPIDELGHGTHVAGIAAALKNNGIGIAGVAAGSTIMPVQASHDRYLEDADIERALLYAIDNGARVINMSLGGYELGAYEDEIRVAYAEDIVLVAAAGNDDTSVRNYPAAMDEVIAVAATDVNDFPALLGGGFDYSYTNCGYWVDIGAPGFYIMSTYGGTYTMLSGTSMAAPHVAGVAALLFSQNKTLSARDVYMQLMHTADPYVNEASFDERFQGRMGKGRLNAYRALTETVNPRPDLTVIAQEVRPYLGPGIQSHIEVRIRNKGTLARNVQANLSSQDTHTTIISGNAYLGDLNFPLSGIADFTIRLDQTASVGSPVDFTLKITSDDTLPMDFEFQLEATALPLKWVREIDGIRNLGHPPIVADINNDGAKEIIFLLPGGDEGESREGQICVLDYQGSDARGWPVVPGPGTNNKITAVAVGNIKGDDRMEIVSIWAEKLGPDQYMQRLYAFNHEGVLLGGFPVTLGSVHTTDMSGISLADINYDGRLDIVARYLIGDGSASQVSLGVYDGRGNMLPGWPYTFDSGFLGRYHAVGDIDNDNELEIVVGLSDTLTYYDTVQALRDDGTLIDDGHWPIEGYNRRFDLSAITLADLDGDDDMEIMVHEPAYERRVGNFVYYEDEDLRIYDHEGNNLVWIPWRKRLLSEGFETSEIIMADLDKDIDNDLEVVTVNYQGQAFAFHHDGAAVNGWSEPVTPRYLVPDEESFVPKPVAGDIDGDGYNEILLWTYTPKLKNVVLDNAGISGGSGRIPVEDSNLAWLHAWNHDGTPVEGFPSKYPADEVGYFKGALALADLDGNGRVDIVSIRSSSLDNAPKTYVSALELDASYGEASMPWAMYRHDPQQTGSHTSITFNNVNRPPVLNTIGNKMIDAGTLLEFTISATDPDGDAITYAVHQAGDLNHDRWVTFPDRQLLLAALGSKQGDAKYNPEADLDNDGWVVNKDWLIFIGLLGKQIPSGLPPEDIASGLFSWTPQNNQIGKHLLTFVASDGRLIDTETVSINVNSPPVLNTIGNKMIDAGTLLEFTISATDPDGDAITYAVHQAGDLNHDRWVTFLDRQRFWAAFGSKQGDANYNPEADLDNDGWVVSKDWLIFIGLLGKQIPSGLPPEDIASGLFSWTPQNNQIGKHLLTFVASDGRLIDTETVSITVKPKVLPVITAVQPYWGRAGARITIRGRNFLKKDNSSKVTFSSYNYRKNAEIISWKDDRIVIEVPKLEYRWRWYKVWVSTKEGQSNYRWFYYY